MPILLERLSVFGIRDPFSALSHAFGALLAIGATLTLVMRAADAGCSRYAVRRMIWYGVSLVVVFSTSFVFHLPDRPPGDLELYKRLDHAAIFLAIGAATTVVYSLVREPWAETMIRLTWSVAGVALVIKMLVWPMPLWMSAVLYMAVGWIAFAGVWMVARGTGWGPLRPLMLSAAVLSMGAIFFVVDRPIVVPGVIHGHELFHMAVLIGIALHWLFVYRHCHGITGKCG